MGVCILPSKDIIVYKVQKKGFYPKALIPLTVKIFCSRIYKVHGIKFESNISYKKSEIAVSLVDYTFPTPLDDPWIPQFTFILYQHNRRIFLKALKLPEVLQNKGVGTYCTRWLKKFCTDFGFECIYGASYENAEIFWEKMGFIKTKENLHE